MNAANILQFLRELSLNNNREWFIEHKAWYEQCRQDFEQLCTELIRRIALYDPEIGHLQAKECIFRIYRDIRFSADKTPYKQHFGCYIAKNGGRNSDYGGYYIHLQPDACSFSGGVWCPPVDLLRALRQSMYDNIEEFLEITGEPEFKSMYPALWTTDKLKVVPRGFPKDWEYADLFKYKHYLVEHEIPETIAQSDQLIDYVAECARVVVPFNRFLNYTVDEVKGFME